MLSLKPFILLLLLSFPALAQKKEDSRIPTEKDARIAEANYKCKHRNRYTIAERLNFYPFNVADKVVLPSEKYKRGTTREQHKKPIKEENFEDFIERFSKDSIFQISRTQFPLRVSWHVIEEDRDSVFYKDRQHAELMDFRKKRYNGPYDRREQKRFVDKNGQAARIEITGIDNGINVTYFFKKLDGLWKLTGIEDSST